MRNTLWCAMLSYRFHAGYARGVTGCMKKYRLADTDLCSLLTSCRTSNLQHWAVDCGLHLSVMTVSSVTELQDFGKVPRWLSKMPGTI